MTSLKRRIVVIGLFGAVALVLMTVGPAIWGATVGSGWRLIAIGGSDATLADGRPTVEVAATPEAFAGLIAGVEAGREVTPPDFERYLVAVVHVGASGSCPPQLGSVDVASARVTVRVSRGLALSCSADLRAYAIVLRLERAALGDDATLAFRVETPERDAVDLTAPVAP
jgi:hypothetical protein